MENRLPAQQIPPDLAGPDAPRDRRDAASWASRSSASPSARPRTVLVDEADIREKARTRVLLAVRANCRTPGLFLRTIFTRPIMFAHALEDRLRPGPVLRAWDDHQYDLPGRGLRPAGVDEGGGLHPPPRPLRDQLDRRGDALPPFGGAALQFHHARVRGVRLPPPALAEHQDPPRRVRERDHRIHAEPALPLGRPRRLGEDPDRPLRR